VPLSPGRSSPLLGPRPLTDTVLRELRSRRERASLLRRRLRRTGSDGGSMIWKMMESGQTTAARPGSAGTGLS
jgi:hypothetical protein